MCVSGIPKRNGPRHIAEIADMALAIKQAVAGFKIPHLENIELKIRIGIHTGPCAAGMRICQFIHKCLKHVSFSCFIYAYNS